MSKLSVIYILKIISTSLDEMLDNTDLLIGPIPYTKDKNT